MIEELLKQYSPEEIVQVLQPMISNARIKRMEEVISKRIRSIHVAVESPADIHNAFAIVRTAEAFGVSHVHFIDAKMKKRQGRSTTRGALHWTHLKKHTSLDAFLTYMQTEKLFLAGACVKKGVPLETLPDDRPLCLLLGNEKRGLTLEAKKACDALYTIPMYGMVESFNLSVSAAISLSKLLEKKRKKSQWVGDLTTEEELEEKAYFFVRSLGIKNAQAILRRSWS